MSIYFTPPVNLNTISVPTDNINSTSFCNQLKNFRGSDGYYYAFWATSDPLNESAYYSSSIDGITWTIQQQLGGGQTPFGYQIAVWYDEPSNTVAFVRVPQTPTGEFFVSYGTLSGGTIIWTQLDYTVSTVNGESSGYVQFPSVYTDGSILWVSVSTSPDGATNYNEVWIWAPLGASWSPVSPQTSPISSDYIYSIIVGVVGGVVQVLGGANPFGVPLQFFETTTNGASWSGPVTTAGNYLMPESSFTPYADTLYLATNDNTNSLGATSYQLGGTLVETSLGFSPGLSFGGAAIGTDGNTFLIMIADSNAVSGNRSILYTQSSPSGTLSLTGVTWSAPAVARLINYLPLFPQIDYNSFGDPYIITWEDLSHATYAMVTSPNPYIAGSVGTGISATVKVFYNKSVTDQSYVQDSVSVTRIPSIPSSGAFGLNAQELEYTVFSYHQQIDMIGQPITYLIQKITGYDSYQHPIIAYTPLTVQAVVTDMANEPYEYTEEGFLPIHYANMWTYAAQPEVGDHVVWQDIEWEVRNSFPKVIGNQTVFYRTVLRRVLSTGTLLSGGTQLVPNDDP